MDFIALDVETANPDLASICQIGVAVFRNGEVAEELSFLVDPEDYFHPMNVSIHGITESNVADAPNFGQLGPHLNQVLSGSICATHTHFDRSAIRQACARFGVEEPSCNWLDTAGVARRSWESVAEKGYGLANLAEMLGIQFNHHDALEDAKAAGRILCAAINETEITIQDWLKRIKQPIHGYHTEVIKQEGNPDGPLFGEVVVFTGALSIPRREAAQLASDLGCAVNSGVTKKVTLLVVGDQDISKLSGHKLSSKHRKALDMIGKGQSIRIIRETDFQALLETN